MIDKGSVIVKMPKYVYNIITNYMADGNLDDVDYLLWELLEELMMGKGPTVDDAEFRERVSHAMETAERPGHPVDSWTLGFRGVVGIFGGWERGRSRRQNHRQSLVMPPACTPHPT